MAELTPQERESICLQLTGCGRRAAGDEFYWVHSQLCDQFAALSEVLLTARLAPPDHPDQLRDRVLEDLADLPEPNIPWQRDVVDVVRRAIGPPPTFRRRGDGQTTLRLMLCKAILEDDDR